jgi:hypothetical protein
MLSDISILAVGCVARPLKLDFQQAVERELKWFVFFCTHKVSPSVAEFLESQPARSGRGE